MMKKIVLITGIAGFVGSHMAEYCLEQGCEVWGTVRPRTDKKNIAHLNGKIHLVECDLMDPTAVEKTIENIAPKYIFHLAAQSDVAFSFQNPAVSLANNITSELNILEAVRNLGSNFIRGTEILIAGSSEEYGAVLAEEFPIKETQTLRPLSPYAVSKVTQEHLALQYHRSYGLGVVVTRAFNHTGPRRGANFAESSWAKQLAEGDTVLHGNLESYRDYTDVRDMVRAYWLAIVKGIQGEVYNVCSGTPHSMRVILEALVRISGRKFSSVKLLEDSKRMRPSDLVYLMGDATKLKVETGWMPKIPLEQTLNDLFHYWKKELKK